LDYGYGLFRLQVTRWSRHESSAIWSRVSGQSPIIGIFARLKSSIFLKPGAAFILYCLPPGGQYVSSNTGKKQVYPEKNKKSVTFFNFFRQNVVATV
jgi:hypothetical protein